MTHIRSLNAAYIHTTHCTWSRLHQQSAAEQDLWNSLLQLQCLVTHSVHDRSAPGYSEDLAVGGDWTECTSYSVTQLPSYIHVYSTCLRTCIAYKCHMQSCISTDSLHYEIHNSLSSAENELLVTCCSLELLLLEVWREVCRHDADPRIMHECMKYQKKRNTVTWGYSNQRH